MRSCQRLGDNPKDYDRDFKGFASECADVNGVRPDVAIPDDSPQVPFEPWTVYPAPPPPHWHWKEDEVISAPHPSTKEFRFTECVIPGEHPWTFEIDDKGVYQVYDPAQGIPSSSYILLLLIDSADHEKTPLFDIPTIREYFVDLDYILGVISDGPTKSFAFRRLKYLSSKFDMYTLLNEYQELADMKRVPHRYA